MGPWAYSAIDARLGPSSHRRLLLPRVLPPHLLQVLRPDEDLARLGALAGAAKSINPALLHHVDEVRGPWITRHGYAPIHAGSSRLSFVCREVDAWPQDDFGARS